ncbi:Seryl-tRNA synthetase (EC [Kosakonia radicincitans]|nr:Seryl-tRNA synthetase (EC [Kosakonia radicincitans]
MLDPNLLRTEPDAVAEKLARRGFKLDVDKLRALEERRKVLQVNTENLQAERNSRSKSIGQAKARGEDIEPLRLEVNKLGEELDAAKAELETLLAEIREIALTIPNLPDDCVPTGAMRTITSKSAAGVHRVNLILKSAIMLRWVKCTAGWILRPL